MKKYKVTCLKCNESDVLVINDSDHVVHDFGNGAGTNLLAARWRGDGEWGFECRCGNDNRLSKHEEKDLKKLVVRGDPLSIKRIADSLKIPDNKQFSMEGA